MELFLQKRFATHKRYSGEGSEALKAGGQEGELVVELVVEGGKQLRANG